jgi:hypothetical protein
VSPVKLSSGSLVIFSPVALTNAVKAKVAEMGGALSYIIAPDIEHHIFISEWAKEYPSAKIIGPEGLPEKRAKMKDPKIGKEDFAVVFTKENKATEKISDEFAADLEHEYVDGHANLEIVLFHKPDKVLIEADLMFNLPAREQFSKASEDQQKSRGILDNVFQKLESTE